MNMPRWSRRALLATGCVALLLLSASKGWADILTLPLTIALIPFFVALTQPTQHAIAAHAESRWCRAALRVPQAGSIAALVCFDVFYPGFGDTNVVLIAGVYQTGKDALIVEVANAITKAAFTVGLAAVPAWVLALLICAGTRRPSAVSPVAPRR